MTGEQKITLLGFKKTLSSEFSDIFEAFLLAGEKQVIVFDKKSKQVLFQITVGGEEICSFVNKDIYVAIAQHCEELGF